MASSLVLNQLSQSDDQNSNTISIEEKKDNFQQDQLGFDHGDNAKEDLSDDNENGVVCDGDNGKVYTSCESIVDEGFDGGDREDFDALNEVDGKDSLSAEVNGKVYSGDGRGVDESFDEGDGEDLDGESNEGVEGSDESRYGLSSDYQSVDETILKERIVSVASEPEEDKSIGPISLDVVKKEVTRYG